MAKPPRRPPGRGGGGRTGTKTILTWAFLLVLAAAVQSQSPSIHTQQTIETLFASTKPLPSPSPNRRAQAGSSPPEIPLLNHHHITTVKDKTTDVDTPIRQFKAVAPAPYGAVRAPLAQPVDDRLTLDPARLLRNWEAENIVLLATIDGAIHARDRKTGEARWSLGIPDSPMIQTTHHCNHTEEGECDHEYIFIVEPSEEGNLYIQHKNPQVGLQRLGITVKSLTSDSPRFVQDPPLVVTSRTDNTAYVVDAASGNILSSFSPDSAFVNDNQKKSCRKLSGFELDDSSCDTIGTINLARKEYLINISNKATGARLCSIKFLEWMPNTGDADLQQQYVAPLDTSHIQTYYNGRIQGLESDPEDGKFHRYTRVLDTPVARVFDVVRPLDKEHEQGELTLLSRPLSAPLLAPAQYWRDDQHRLERVFVNKTESGIWFALSELSYPGVTAGAKPAPFHWNYDSLPIDFESNMEDIIGVHVLSTDRQVVPMRLTIDGRSTNSDVEPEKALAPGPYVAAPSLISSAGMNWSLLANLVVFLCFIVWVGVQYKIPAAVKAHNFLMKHGVDVKIAASKSTEISTTEEVVATAATEVPPAEDQTAEMVDEAVADAVATPVRSRTQSTAQGAASPQKQVNILDSNEQDSEAESEGEAEAPASGDSPENGANTGKRRTKRGKRGGVKNKKKKQQMEPAEMDSTAVVAKVDRTPDGITTVGRLTMDTTEPACLGRGSNGTIVYPGTFDGRIVAVKRLVKQASALAAREIKHLLSSDENPHVVRYHGKEESPDFIFIALDLFRTSLDRFVERPQEFPDLVLSPSGFDVKDCLTQITEGVAHLHSLKLVHRDIKPQNVLVRSIKTNRPTTTPKLNFVISDFGLCKPLEEGPESAFAPTANHTAAGTTGWRAPELLVSYSDSVAAPITTSKSQSTNHSATGSVDGTVIETRSGRRATKAIDIFSLGCVFYYVMTQGRHPFDIGGHSLGRDLNIKENRFSTKDLMELFSYPYDADDLILQMIQHDPKHRPDTSDVLKHTYFWDAETKLEFICAVSDAYEKEKNSISDIHNSAAPRTPAEMESLEELAALQALGPNVISKNDFLAVLPRSFVNEMGKQRKYTGSKMIDLLRVIRNKKNHFHDLPEDVKELMLGGSTKGYWEFWEKRFPSLLINCHCIILERNLKERLRMERWYE